MRIGIYGGTFNPIHYGHLLLAQTALEKLALQQVIFVPSGIPPLKGIDQLVNAQQRLHMVSLAIASNPSFSLCDFEVVRPQKSYTIDTVHYLTKKFDDNCEFFFILGDDCAANLHRWKGITELCQLLQFVQVRRSGCNLPEQTPALLTMEMETICVSSTLLRNCLLNHQEIDNLTPPAVVQYIQQHALYRSVTPCTIGEQ